MVYTNSLSSMLNDKIMVKACRSFTIFAFLMIVAILPAIAAEEEGNAIPPSLEERIKGILESETKKNPDVKEYKVIVMIDFQRDSDSGKWTGSLDDITVSTGSSTTDDLDGGSDAEAVDDADDSTVEGNAGGSSASNNIISWVLGAALIIAILMLILPSLKKRLRCEPTVVDNTDNQRNASTGSHGGNTENKRTRYDNGRWNESGSGQKQEEITKVIEAATQTAVAGLVVAVDVTEKAREAEEAKVVEGERQTGPVTPSKPIVKYGQIAVLSQDELVTESDYMTDNAADAPFEFTFSLGMEEGTYDIASSSLQSFLSDVSMIRPYVQDFDALANPTKIVTITKGKLRKKGVQWVVTEKAKIELK